jgi:hypothetical protein
MNNIIRLLSLTAFFLIGFATFLSAQTPPPGGGTSSNAAPIDGGVSILVGGAAYLGYRKIKEMRSNKKS